MPRSHWQPEFGAAMTIEAPPFARIGRTAALTMRKCARTFVSAAPVTG